MSKPQTLHEAVANLDTAMTALKQSVIDAMYQSPLGSLMQKAQTRYLGNGIIYFPPKCPECKRDKPNEIQDGNARPLYQCVACGHLWERVEIPVSNVCFEYTTVKMPVQKRLLNEPQARIERADDAPVSD